MKAVSSSLAQGRWNYTGKVYHRQQRGDESVWRLLRDNSTGAQHMTECSITKSCREPFDAMSPPGLCCLSPHEKGIAPSPILCISFELLLAVMLSMPRQQQRLSSAMLVP